MAVQLNHTIAYASEPAACAAFLSEMLGVGAPTRYGPFHVVEVDNEVSIDFMEVGSDDEVVPQHYAFLVSDEEFDEIYGRILERGLEHFADPGAQQPNQVNTRDGGRGVYWADPAGHFLEILTVPYGGWRDR